MYLKATYQQIVDAFGEPNAQDMRHDIGDWDGKVVCEWEIKEKDFYVRIYDWKQTKEYTDDGLDSVEEVTEWEVSSTQGCKDDITAETAVKLVERIPNSKICEYDFTDYPPVKEKVVAASKELS